MSRPPDPPQTRRDRRALERADRSRPRPRARTAPPPRPAWRSPFALVSLGAVVVAVVLVVALGAKPPDTEGDLIVPGSSYPADLVDGEKLGRPDAPLAMEIYGDFQCPVCGRFAKEYLPRLVADFVKDGRLRLIPRDIAILDPGSAGESLGSAVGAVCAGVQDRYWEYHDLLFWNQAGENLGAFRAERLALMAEALDLDRAAWDECVADPARGQAVRALTTSAAARGIVSTPTLAINGQLSVGLPQSYDTLTQIMLRMLEAGVPTPLPE